MNSRLVKKLRTHSAIFVGDTLGDLGTTLPNPGKTLVLTMYAQDAGVVVSVRRPNDAKSTELIVPWPNVQFAVFETEVKKD